MILLIDI